GHCRGQIGTQRGLVQAGEAEQLHSFIALNLAVPLRADGAYRLQGLKEALAAFGLRRCERLGHRERGDVSPIPNPQKIKL
ncbi:MAG: hypothetical protein IKQ29_03885, partial [Bacilli bacterium]|nr:hypothetical protein [Bacilli bacterium]